MECKFDAVEMLDEDGKPTVTNIQLISSTKEEEIVSKCAYGKKWMGKCSLRASEPQSAKSTFDKRGALRQMMLFADEASY